MVEFSLAIFVFILGVVGLIDVGRAIYDEHGLTRAAESIAHSLVLQYATVTNFPGSQSALTDTLTTTIQQAHAQSDTGLNATTLSLVSPGGGTAYQLFSNSAGSGGAAVSVCLSPNYAAPNVIKVTVVGAFTPAISAFVGGRTINLSESASALTFLGQQGSGTYQNSCP
jgi:Flp pilus assembly protein TadG